MTQQSPVTLEDALAAHRANDFQKAEALYRLVLAREPDNADALALRGAALSSLGAHDEAVASIARAVSLDPRAALFAFHQASILTEAGRLDEALVAFDRTLSLAPQMVEAYYNKGNALRLLGRKDEAREAYAAAIRLDPAHALARNNLALIAMEEEKYDEAEAELLRVVDLAPELAAGWLSLCLVAEKAGDYQTTLRAGLEASRRMPDNPDAWLGLGVAQCRLENYEEGLTAFQKAKVLKPNWPELIDNIGQAHQFLGQLDEAEAAFHEVLRLTGEEILDEDLFPLPDKAFGRRHWNLALLELLKGDYPKGFARYRARLQKIKWVRRPAYAYPTWRGEDLAGKTLMIDSEQGMGDMIMLARYLPLLRARGARVLLRAPDALAPLFDRPSCANLCTWTPLEEGRVPAFDYHALSFDLPLIFRTTPETIPSQTPYLEGLPPNEKTRLAPFDGLKVGLVWSGSVGHQHDGRRSLALGLFEELVQDPAIRFYAMARELKPGDAEKLAAWPVVDLKDKLSDFGDTARFLGQMDLLISCDSAPAHLAGALGLPVWLLLPFAPDWRWGQVGEATAWYPSMRLFRQSKSGDWPGVLARVKAALEEQKARR